MALNSRSSIDPRWFTHSRAVSAGLQVATVQIYNPESNDKTYDAITNTWTGGVTELYIGPARIQPPSSSASESAQEYNPTTLQSVRIILPLGKNILTGSGGLVPDIRPNHRVRVTNSPYNPTLESFLYVVVGVLNSSNAWERTLLCRADIELDPNNV